jgi:hypothetical protein
MSSIRSRWAAIGAAVAVTLGAGGIGLVSATSPADAVTFVPITPCRVMDTRSDSPVGPRTTPLGPGETYTVNATTDNTGNCGTNIPTTATGVSLNVTAVGAALPTFLTIWATGSPQPEASSLNPVPDAPPTPNAVTTGIDAGGQFNIYNLQGNVQVIADINGYYTDHNHDDRYVRTPGNEIPLDLYRLTTESSSWVLTTKWSHGATGFADCVGASTTIPVGRSVTGVRLAYVAPSGATLNLVAFSVRGSAGSRSDADSVQSTDPMVVQPTSASTVASVTLPIVIPGEAERSDMVGVCTPQELDLYGVTLLLD